LLLQQLSDDRYFIQHFAIDWISVSLRSIISRVWKMASREVTSVFAEFVGDMFRHELVLMLEEGPIRALFNRGSIRFKGRLGLFPVFKGCTANGSPPILLRAGFHVIRFIGAIVASARSSVNPSSVTMGARRQSVR
jgi:hypothetical protein